MPHPPDFFQALADATRWEIVCRLADGPRCVCELTECLAVPQSTLSTHLQVLRAHGVLAGERRGRWMYYGIAREARPVLRALWRHFPPAYPAAGAGVTATEAGCTCPEASVMTSSPIAQSQP
jgi:ArsR family transcriptional regulator